MNPIGIAAGAAAILAAIFYGLWQSEIGEHQGTRDLLQAANLKAETATKTANANAEKVTELRIELAERKLTDKHHEEERARLMAERDRENFELRQRLGAFNDAIFQRPKVAERAFRIDLNHSLRELSNLTCRADCGSEGGKAQPGRAKASGSDRAAPD